MDFFIHDLSNRFGSPTRYGHASDGNAFGDTRPGIRSLICAVLLIYLADSFVQQFFDASFSHDTTSRLIEGCALSLSRHRKGAISTQVSTLALSECQWEAKTIVASLIPSERARGFSVSAICITSKDPIVIVWLVNALRRKGYIIGLTEPEARKPDTARQRQKEIAESNSIGNIRNMFEYRETDFEEYCAELFRLEGYEAKTTPPTADGGYDIDMTDPDGRRCFVECKCVIAEIPSAGRCFKSCTGQIIGKKPIDLSLLPRRIFLKKPVITQKRSTWSSSTERNFCLWPNVINKPSGLKQPSPRSTSGSSTIKTLPRITRPTASRTPSHSREAL